jgi:hypothetical protein
MRWQKICNKQRGACYSNCSTILACNNFSDVLKERGCSSSRLVWNLDAALDGSGGHAGIRRGSDIGKAFALKRGDPFA